MKKGTVGYIVRPWNHTGYGKTIFDYISQDVSTWDWMIRKVEVHSCGKKVMRLKWIDEANEVLSGTKFDPETIIYESMDDVVEASKQLFKDTQEKSIQRANFDKDRLNELNFSEAKYNAALKAYDMIVNGEIEQKLMTIDGKYVNELQEMDRVIDALSQSLNEDNKAIFDAMSYSDKKVFAMQAIEDGMISYSFPDRA